MKAHLRLSDEQRQTIEDLNISSGLSQDDFESFNVDNYTLGYKVKSLKTGEMTDTGIRVFKQDAGAYNDLNGVYSNIINTVVALNGKLDPDEQDNSKKINNIFDDILGVSSAAVTEFESYFGDGSMSGVTTARFGRKMTPNFSFTLDVLAHVAAILVVGTTQELHRFSSAANNALNSVDTEAVTSE